jgi:hypothetical protein
MSDIPSRDPGQPLVFRVVSAPAGWRIVGVDAIAMSTLYLSRDLAAAHARELAEVLKGHGQRARVVVEGEHAAD